jgi:hypothetical protein
MYVWYYVYSIMYSIFNVVAMSSCAMRHATVWLIPQQTSNSIWYVPNIINTYCMKVPLLYSFNTYLFSKALECFHLTLIFLVTVLQPQILILQYLVKKKLILQIFVLVPSWLYLKNARKREKTNDRRILSAAVKKWKKKLFGTTKLREFLLILMFGTYIL